MMKSCRNVLTCLFLTLLLVGCASDPSVSEPTTVREAVFPPKQYLEKCEPSFKSNAIKDVIAGLDRALGECNSQIAGINKWVEEMKTEDETQNTPYDENGSK